MYQLFFFQSGTLKFISWTSKAQIPLILSKQYLDWKKKNFRRIWIDFFEIVQRKNYRNLKILSRRCRLLVLHCRLLEQVTNRRWVILVCTKSGRVPSQKELFLKGNNSIKVKRVLSEWSGGTTSTFILGHFQSRIF